jgi:1-deoxy-D-xylulose-5-phosphate reductoisomerase
MKKVTILGSTGSVGTSTVDVIKSQGDKFQVHALTANKNINLLAQQARELKADIAVVADEALYGELKELLSGTHTDVRAGRQAIIDVASEPVDWTMAAILGMAGLEPILAALRNCKTVAIANKEPLVAAGPLVMETARKHGATILPVDSEHNAIFQVLEPENKSHVERLILTASGGPFRTASLEEMEAATPDKALAHPNWSMGAKISIDSATMMNKALEVIEARYLFDMPPEQIDVLVHPQSIIHSMVEYKDGSVLAQMGASDMRVPIAHCLGWPERLSGTAQRIDFLKLSNLTFEATDHRRFPAINHAYACLKQGQAACIAFNASNEVAVQAFLDGQIGFLDIFAIVQAAVEENPITEISGLETIIFCDEQVRAATKTRIVNNEHIKRKVS